MASDIPIDDPADPRLAEYRNIADAELLTAHHAFVAEGRLVVRRLLKASRCRCRSVLVTPAARASLDDALASVDVPVFVCSLDVLRQITGYDMHRGCLAIGERPDPIEPFAMAAQATLLVVLEGVGNADNVGGIFRTAAAFGAGGVVLGPGCCDPLYRKAIRTSMAAALSLPFAMDRAWPASLDGLRAAGWIVLALTPAPDAVPLERLRLPGSSRVALLLGSEGEGLTAAAQRRADIRVRIGMPAAVDSLNVGVAAGIALHAVAARGADDRDAHEGRAHVDRPDAGGAGDEEPRACPRCGASPMLFTPNARRRPYAEIPVYEPAWQCTKCGHLVFVADSP
jgi:tRNA G18 (ribose-2'-O)-methylase SpoU/ribosomal protein S27AE